MARPKKNGLDYFPIDVDIFDDEKIVPVSCEFGAKGECIVIRVLCAIYRNGYFAECSDAFIFKIAKQANVPFSLVSEVISGLVKWGFFDKSVFDSFRILTSRGIQKRWLEATRKRVINYDELPFWLLSVKSGKKFPAEETPVSGGRNSTKHEFPAEETPQSKIKYSRLDQSNKEEILKEEKNGLISAEEIPVSAEETSHDKPEKEKKPKRFVPPSVEEVKAYIIEKNYSVDAETFVNWYEAKDWFIGKNKMKNWRAAVVTWEKKNNNDFKKQNQIIKNIDDLCKDVNKIWLNQ